MCYRTHWPLLPNTNGPKSGIKQDCIHTLLMHTARLLTVSERTACTAGVNKTSLGRCLLPGVCLLRGVVVSQHALRHWSFTPVDRNDTCENGCTLAPNYVMRMVIMMQVSSNDAEQHEYKTKYKKLCLSHIYLIGYYTGSDITACACGFDLRCGGRGKIPKK